MITLCNPLSELQQYTMEVEDDEDEFDDQRKILARHTKITPIENCKTELSQTKPCLTH